MTSASRSKLVWSVGYPDWPTEIVEIEQRYSDAPPARLRVLTSAAFVASKLSSWSNRGASRDLYDLWALAEAGMIDAEAAALFAKLGTYTSASKVPFTRIPTDAEWSRSPRPPVHPRGRTADCREGRP